MASSSTNTGGSAMRDDTSLKKCAICLAPNVQKCQRCKMVAYCSTICQESDWPIHKILCGKVESLGPRPSPNHKLAIHLPQVGKPKFVWVEYKRLDHDREEPGTGDPQNGEIEKLLGRGVPGPPLLNVMIYQNHYRSHPDTDMKDEVGLYCRYEVVEDAFAIGRQNITPNGAVSIITGNMPHLWFRPMFLARYKVNNDFKSALKKNPSLQHAPLVHHDINLADFRKATDFFLMKEGCYLFRRNFELIGRGVNCDGEVESGKKKYTAVLVPKDHPVFQNKSVPEISRLVGFPILVRKTITKRPLRDTSATGTDMDIDGPDPFMSNSELTYLHLNADQQASSWGCVSSQWDVEVGNVLIVHQNKRDITPQDIEALVSYSVNVVQPAMEDSVQRGTATARQEVMELLTKERFNAYRLATFPVPQADELRSNAEKEAEMKIWLEHWEYRKKIDAIVPKALANPENFL